MNIRICFLRSSQLCRVVNFCSLLALCLPDLWCHSASAFPVNDNNGSNPPVFKYNRRSWELTPSLNYTFLLQSSHTDYDSQPHPGQNPDNLKRLGRGVNNQMIDFLNHSVIVAHIANGIALQAGLMNSSFPIDDVVGELLNLGSVGVSGIRSFQSDKVAALTSNLKEIGNKLNAGKDIIAAELSVFRYNDLCTAPFLGQNATVILHNDDYFKELGSILNSSLAKTVDGYNKTLNSIEMKLTDISRIIVNPTTEKYQQRDAVHLFQDIPASFQFVVEYTDELEKTVRDLKSKKAIYGAPTYFESLATLLHLRNVRKSIDSVIVLKKQYLEENVNIVSQRLESIKTAGNMVQKMQLLISGRTVHSVSGNKRYTSGFSSGIADVKQLENEVNDSWISTILNINQEDLHKLGEGLLPLFTASAAVKSLDDKLVPVSNSTVYHSLLNMAKLHSEVSAMKPHSFNMSEVLEKYSLCTKSLTYNIYNTKPVEDFLKNVTLLKNSLDAITEYVSNTTVRELKKEFEKFYSTLAFKDINNVTQSVIDLPEVITKLNKSALESLKGRVSIVKEALNNATKNDINALVNNLNDDKATIYETEVVFDYELTMLKCLKEIKNKSSNMAKAFQVIQKLRSLDQIMLATAEHVAMAVAEVSKNIDSITALPAQMKDGASNITEMIIQLPDSARTSLIIGQSANSLRNAYDLLVLEPSIALLKSIDSTVREEIRNISNTEERKNVSEQWGIDHAKDMAQLDASLAAVKVFSNKLNTASATTIGDYGVPLIELATIPDVKIGAAEKSKALETLIDRNPKVKSLLGPNKDTLDAIASLDLQFSSHKTQLESAPTAFEAIQNFLSQVLPTPTNPPTYFPTVTHDIPVTRDILVTGGIPVTRDIPVTGGIPVTRNILVTRHVLVTRGILVAGGVKNRIPWVWILLGVLTAFAVVLGCVAIIVLCMNKLKKKKKEKKLKKILLLFMEKQTYPSIDVEVNHMNRCMANVLIMQKGETGSSEQYLDIEKCRYYNIGCNPKTAVKFKIDKVNIKIHANMVSASTFWREDEARFIATQAPLPETIEDFWAMVVHFKCNFVVMLCKFMEDGKSKADPYFALGNGKEQTFGRFTIKTTSVETILNKTVKKRTLVITDKLERLPTRTVTHFQYLHWKDHGIPEGHKDICELMEIVEKDKNPIVVHCSAGIGRTMAFIGIHTATQMVIRRPEISVEELLNTMRDQRWKCIQTASQLRWLILGIIYKLIKMFNLHTDVYDNEIKVFREISDAYDYESVVVIMKKKKNNKKNRQAAGKQCEGENYVKDVSIRNDETIILVE